MSPQHPAGFWSNGNLRLMVQVLGAAVLAGGALYELRDLKEDVRHVAEESRKTSLQLVELNTRLKEKIEQADKDHARYDRHLDVHVASPRAAAPR